MVERAILFEVGFSVSDAEYPRLTLDEGSLLLEYNDWQEQPVKVRFRECVGLRWQETDSKGNEGRDDSVYEIIESCWLNEYLTQGVCLPGEGMRHFRLCFNPHGVLDVIAKSLALVSSESEM